MRAGLAAKQTMTPTGKSQTGLRDWGHWDSLSRTLVRTCAFPGVTSKGKWHLGDGWSSVSVTLEKTGARTRHLETPSGDCPDPSLKHCIHCLELWGLSLHSLRDNNNNTSSWICSIFYPKAMIKTKQKQNNKTKQKSPPTPPTTKPSLWFSALVCSGLQSVKLSCLSVCEPYHLSPAVRLQGHRGHRGQRGQRGHRGWSFCFLQ